MPGSVYLQPSEYASFNLASSTNAGLVQQASALIDGFLQRPEGLVWTEDGSGAPCYMNSPSPTLTLTAPSGGISPGTNVVVQYAGPALDNNSVGEVLVLDRTNTGITEACVIQAVGNSPNTVTLQTVQFAHGSGATMEFGLTIQEQREVPKDRSVVLLANPQIMQLQSGVGRYGYGRRSQQIMGNFQEFNLLAVVSAFGGPPLWIPWQTTDAGLNRSTGECWIPAGILLAYYTEVKIWYIAGFQQSALPFNVKQACANIVGQLKETGLGPNIRRRDQKDGVGSQRFENEMIDPNSRDLLRPYHARIFG
jgi:hypothetical protein